MSDTTNGGNRRPGGLRGGGGKERGPGGARPPRFAKGPGKGFRPGGGTRGGSEGGESGGDKPRAKPARFARGPEDRPTGDRKEFRPRDDRKAGEGRPFKPRREASESGGGERKPFRPRDGGAPRQDDRPPRENAPREARAERTPFRPRSHGTLSHGGAKAEGGERPRSFGRRSHEEGGGRGPRPLADERRPRREDAPQDDRRAFHVEDETVGTMRIAKRLARAGIASRRDAEGMIADGRVKLNGAVLQSPAVDVSASDAIEIDGVPLPPIERPRLWLVHKPAGLVTTNRDPEGRPTVFDRLPEDMPRVLTVGRLDINTEGLLLLTNDGGLSRILELPATGWLRRYRVRAFGEVSQESLDELRGGIALDGVFYGAIEATLDRTQGDNVWLTLGLREGKNREVKRVLGHLGLEVNRLIRLSFGPFQLGELPEGAVQEVRGRTLRDQLGPSLIADAGADFDAPVAKPFSNKPVLPERRSEGPAKPFKRGDWVSASDPRAGAKKPNRRKFGEAKREEALGRFETRAPRPDAGDRPSRPDRPPRGDRPSGERPSGDRPARDEEGERPRRPGNAGGPDGFGRGKSFGDKHDGEGGRSPPRFSPSGTPRRSANVWMAPGARATGEKRKAEREEREKRGPAGTRTPRADAGDRPPRPDRPGGARPSRGDRPPRGDRPTRGDGPPRGRPGR